MSEYEKMMEYLCNAKPIGTQTVFYKGRAFRVDHNYNPPKVEEIEL